jgi:hypothetical protein
MRSGRAVVVLWSLVIVALVVLELAEVTHLFTFPISAVLADPVTLVVSLVFTTIVAIIGAIFVGIYISTRLLGPRGFSPFEEEMLHMREDLRELRRSVDDLRERPPTRGNEPGAGGGGRR